MKKISVTFLLHPSRKQNLDKIHDAYKDYDFIDDVLVITGLEINTKRYHKKFRFIQIPGPYTYGTWPHVGLLSRYNWALCCYSRYVLLQDDDIIHSKETIKYLIDQDACFTGTHPRWFDHGTYHEIPKKTRNSQKIATAPIIITRGVLLDSQLLPDVIKYAKYFWKDYYSVFNGEDIFLARAISHITTQEEFVFFNEGFTNLPTHNVELHQKINKEGSRTEITKKIYKFFEGK